MTSGHEMLRRLLRERPITGDWPRDLQGRTPLELSVLHQNLPCAVRLLEVGATIMWYKSYSLISFVYGCIYDDSCGRKVVTQW